MLTSGDDQVAIRKMLSTSNKLLSLSSAKERFDGAQELTKNMLSLKQEQVNIPFVCKILYVHTVA